VEILTAATTDAATEPSELLHSSCGICLTEEMTNPFLLDGCKHVFCFACVQQYQEMLPSQTQTSGAAATCPCCPSEMDDIKEATESRAALHVARAAAPRVSEEYRIEQCNLAMGELQKLLETNEESSITTHLLGAEVLDMMGDRKQALIVLETLFDKLKEGAERAKKEEDLMAQLNEYLDSEENQDSCASLLDEAEAVALSGIMVTESDLIDAIIKIAVVHQKLKDRKGARELYHFLLITHKKDWKLTPEQDRQVYMALSRLEYEDGNYKSSISCGEAALKMNRHFPSYQYVALSYFKLGKIEEAKKTMSRAMLYETPWCDRNRANIRKVWEGMISEGCE
jgi:tetratricopeptide (TPR) repeat protein